MSIEHILGAAATFFVVGFCADRIYKRIRFGAGAVNRGKNKGISSLKIRIAIAIPFAALAVMAVYLYMTQK